MPKQEVEENKEARDQDNEEDINKKMYSTKLKFNKYSERREYYARRLWNKKELEKDKNKKRRRKMSEFADITKSKRKESTLEEKSIETKRTTKDFLSEKPFEFLKEIPAYYNSISQTTFSIIITTI